MTAHCNCRSLPAAFAWDPARELLAGHTREVDRDGSMRLLACGSCGQLWRLELPPELSPHAQKVDRREAWTREPRRPSLLESHDPAPGPRLPVLATVSAALARCWAERASAAKVAAVPWLIASAGALGVGLASAELPDPPPRPWPVLRDLVGTAVWVFAAALFGIAWHRRILLGEPIGSWARVHSWTPRHAPFMAWSFVLTLIYLPWVLFGLWIWMDSLLLVLLLHLAGLWLYARLSVGLPSTAVGGAADPRSAWQLSRGAGLRLLFIGLVAGLAASIVLLPLSALLLKTASLRPAWEIALLPLWELHTFVLMAVEITALSLAYRWLREEG